MHRKEPLSTQVFKKLYRFPIRGKEPTSWREHVKQNLVPEIRHEVEAYFGQIQQSDEAYPGLDYGYAPHRRRLARRPHHNRLFIVFDELKLTHGEIRDLCNWDFTLYHKLKAERDYSTTIYDRTGEDIPTWEALEERRRAVNAAASRRLATEGYQQVQAQEQQIKEDEDEVDMDEDSEEQDLDELETHGQFEQQEAEIHYQEPNEENQGAQTYSEGERLQALRELLRAVPMDELPRVEETILEFIGSSQLSSTTTAATF